MDLGVVGSTSTVHKVKDTVLVNDPVTKVTANAVFLGDKYFIRKDANYIVVDSNKGILRQAQIVTSNQTATVSQPVKTAATAVTDAASRAKEAFGNAIDSTEGFLSGLGDTLKWVIIGVVIIGAIILFAQLKSATS